MNWLTPEVAMGTGFAVCCLGAISNIVSRVRDAQFERRCRL